MISTIRKQPEPVRPPTRRRHLISRALAGLLAAAAVLGVGELVAVLIAPAAAPFLAVGSSTVDRTPAWAREFAIQTFGTDDKPALFVGMALTIAAIAAVAGIAERTRGPIGSLILGMLGVVGVAAALARPGATWVYAVPTMIGTVAGITALRILTGAARDPIAPDDGAAYSRRRFLVLASTATAVAAAGVAGARYLGQQIAGALEDRLGFRIPGVAVRDRAPAIGAGTDVGIPGVASFITPNAEFYRIDTALRVPQLTTAQWRLRIHGMVDRELTLTWDDLTARTPIERVITLTCVSNEVGGNLAGNAAWIGYPIAPLLAEVGVTPDADMLLSTSTDGFTTGTPLAVLRDGRDAMLAVAMNGEPLPFEHGYPVRQVVPGLYGFVSATKWVVDWEVTRFDRAQAYWTKRGWGQQAPIKTASRIELPAALAPVGAGRVLVAGTAWAQHRGIAKVEVRVDDDAWNPATLAPQYSIDTWRQWTWQWDAVPGPHALQVRATDLDGNTQPVERVAPIPDGATGWHTRSLTVT